MSLTKAVRVGIGLCLVLGLGFFAAWAQEKAPPQSARPDGAAKNRRLAYVVQHTSAKDLAGLLSKHFKDEAEVQAQPDSLSNLLLINAPAATFDEIVKLLVQLDRRPETVVVEVFIVAVAPKKDDGKEKQAAKDLDAKEFSGPAADVLAKLRARQANGQIGLLRNLQLTLVEGRTASVLLGEQKPYVTGIIVTGTGRTARTIAYRSVGTQLRATAHVTEKKIEIDLDLNDARSVPDDTIVLGKDEMGQSVYATDFVTSRLTSNLTVAAGQAIAAEGVQTTSKSGTEQALVIVTAKIIDPNAKPEPEVPTPPVRPRRPNPRFNPPPADRNPFLDPVR